ncbi:PREDICTED: mannose-P-dolichol utilization defect 1 protein-like [Priapulus caudatus]|uniref:Solute carrier family 66 member 3 n=1 Tax=Priapulus caudatus TaxID=37621 RepID=A0ABM1EYT7_PRICU|nr:PREDICTED: mannose-P-dolichol utilization defect 1 protein-like [Priapulus caudatus]
METFVKDFLLTEQCFDEFFVKANFLHVACLKMLISKCLGYLIILGAVIVKLPQIIKIWSAKSGEGVSFLSQSLELAAVTATVSYSFANKFPFSAWGEGFFLILQTCTICVLVLHYGGKLGIAVVFMLAYSAVLSLMLSGLVPINILWIFQSCNIAIVIGSKLVQILSSYNNGGTGQLSVITFSLLFLGSIARIFTSIQETGDNLIILIYVLATTLNGVIFGQVLYYWNAPVPSTKTKIQ